MANQVQSTLASGILDSFHVSIGLSLQSKQQDWQGRQATQYGAMKGLTTQDFHGLADFNNEMSSYSSTNGILMSAWNIIKNLVPNNPTITSTLVNITGFGMVGQQVLSLVGVTNLLIAPQDVLQNSSTFDSTISSVS
jgi:hypothetical protein